MTFYILLAVAFIYTWVRLSIVIHNQKLMNHNICHIYDAVVVDE